MRNSREIVRQKWLLGRSYRAIGASVGVSVGAVSLTLARALDAQLTWHPRPNWELELGVQNATDPRHPEYSAISVTPTTEARRNVFVRGQWRF